MANKRQRLAKKRRAGGAVGQAYQAGDAVPTKKPLKAAPKSRKILKKHSLRVAGQKPGDGCFVCQSTDHVAKACPQKLGKEKKMICLLCRKRGHSLKNCPNQSTEEEKKCYNCGSFGHRLADCKEPLKNGGTTFASCFLCKKEGHLSKNCPSNTHGIYPKGGCCKVCGGVTHLAKDCPQEKKTTKSGGAQRDKLVISREAAPTLGKHAKRIVFGSGDDLGDDFVDLEVDKDEEKRSERSKPASSMHVMEGMEVLLASPIRGVFSACSECIELVSSLLHHRNEFQNLAHSGEDLIRVMHTRSSSAVVVTGFEDLWYIVKDHGLNIGLILDLLMADGDIGALRLDIINTAETFKFTTNLRENFQAAHAPSTAGTDVYSGRTTSTLVAHTVEGKIVNNFRQPKSRNSHCKQSRQRRQHNVEEEAACSSVASPAFPSDRLFREQKVARDLLKMDPTNIQLMGLPYPQPLINFATTIQTCYLVFLMVWFAFLQLSISLVYKSIVLLEGSGFAGNELAEGEVFSSNSADFGAWHLCLTDSDGNEGYSFNSESTQDLRPAGKSSLEEAWHVAEHYLNEALENDCQGVYFSYNCTSPQQEAPESALGRWNRDPAGRLIRQLWP
ncbi:hypothetical protein L7F22_018047 [Adiantum nelumboides]|nr:hypothetical protein [Adiantum nelumboides]